MDGKSLDISELKMSQLQEIFPDIFAEGKIDFQKLRDSLGEDVFVKDEHYELTWAGKSEARKEIQKQSTATLIPDLENSIDFEKSNNILIEGENLEVLRVLQKSYFGKIKMIYIDPPYNTGSDSFVYPDDYTERQDEYKKRTGITDEYGMLNKQDLWKKNTKENGQFHSVWLSMMYPRIYLSRNLLREDGVIFISIDDNEYSNLKNLCDEIYGEDNFLADIIWNSTKSVTNTAIISVSHTHNLVYFKNMNYFVKNRTEFRLPEDGEGFSNPDNDPRGDWKADPFQVGGWRPNQQYEIVNPKTGESYFPNTDCSWKNDFIKYQELIKDDRIVFGSSGESGPQRKRFLTEALDRGKVTKTLWNDLGTTTNGTQTLKKLFNGKAFFTNPKPVDLIERMLQLSTNSNENHLILDFFAGSGTTGQSVLELNKKDNGNRRFILVQIPEDLDNESEGKKAGYNTIADILRTRIRKVIKNIRTEYSSSIAFDKYDLPALKCFKLVESNFKIWRNDINGKKEVAQQLLSFANAEKENSTPELLFFELCLKSGLDLSVRYSVDKNFFKTEDGFWFCFEKYNDNMKNDIIQNNPQKVVFLNSCFSKDVQLSNLMIEMKKYNIQVI